jgi:hypothetical protein
MTHPVRFFCGPLRLGALAAAAVWAIPQAHAVPFSLGAFDTYGILVNDGASGGDINTAPVNANIGIGAVTRAGQSPQRNRQRKSGLRGQLCNGGLGRRDHGHATRFSRRSLTIRISGLRQLQRVGGRDRDNDSQESFIDLWCRGGIGHPP